MLKTFHAHCPDCVNLQQLLCDIDSALVKYGKNEWLNISFDLQKPFPKCLIRDLLHYKRIITKKIFNPSYVCQFPLEQLVTQIKILTNK